MALEDSYHAQHNRYTTKEIISIPGPTISSSLVIRHFTKEIMTTEKLSDKQNLSTMLSSERIVFGGYGRLLFLFLELDESSAALGPGSGAFGYVRRPATRGRQQPVVHYTARWRENRDHGTDY